MGLQEGGGLLHAGLELHPVGDAVGEDLRVAGVVRVGLRDRHDVGGLQRVRQLLDLGAGGVAKLDPGQRGARRGGIDRETLAQLGDVERAGRQVLRLVGNEHEEAAIGRIVAHQHGAIVRHDLHQLVRDAAHAIVLHDAAGAVRMHRDLGEMAVMIGIGLRLVAEEVAAVLLEDLVAVDEGRVGLVLLARQVSVPRRQAGAAGDPQAMCLRRIDVVVLDQAELAGARVLIERQDGDRRRQGAVGLGTTLVGRRVFELHDGEDRLALDPRHGGVRQRQQGGAVRRVGEHLPLLARHRFVDDRLVVDVDIGARQDRAALAVRHHVAGDEEGLVGELELVGGVVTHRHGQGRADRGRRHRRGVGEAGRRRRAEPCGDKDC